jgi:hypothetical protein
MPGAVQIRGLEKTPMSPSDSEGEVKRVARSGEGREEGNVAMCLFMWASNFLSDFTIIEIRDSPSAFSNERNQNAQCD